MKRIEFTEYTYVLNEYTGEVEISDEDYLKLKNEEITMEFIMDKYELDYDGSQQLYDDSRFDSIEWEDA